MNRNSKEPTRDKFVELHPNRTLKPASNGLQLPEDLNSYTTVNRTVLGTMNPDAHNGPEPVLVPDGFGYYFLSAINNGWTDNKDNGSNPPLEGWDFHDENEYIQPARRAQLVAMSGPDTYTAYEVSLDRSRGGTQYVPNTSGRVKSLTWYMNDNKNHYGDNAGSAVITIAIIKNN
jgi:hypothetical protein